MNNTKKWSILNMAVLAINDKISSNNKENIIDLIMSYGKNAFKVSFGEDYPPTRKQIDYIISTPLKEIFKLEKSNGQTTNSTSRKNGKFPGQAQE